MELVCGVCYECFNNNHKKPMVLSCGHSFCQECINSISSGFQPLCPSCRCQFDPKTSRPNFMLIQVVDSGCASEPSKKKDFISCTEHNEPCDIFCSSCQRLLCRSCYNTEDAPHSKCVRISISTALYATANCAQALEARVQKYLKKLEGDKRLVHQQFSQFETEYHKAESLIQIEFSKLISSLQSCKNELVNCLRHHHGQGKDYFLKIHKDISASLHKGMGMMRQLESLQVTIDTADVLFPNLTTNQANAYICAMHSSALEQVKKDTQELLKQDVVEAYSSLANLNLGSTDEAHGAPPIRPPMIPSFSFKGIASLEMNSSTCVSNSPSQPPSTPTCKTSYENPLLKLSFETVPETVTSVSESPPDDIKGENKFGWSLELQGSGKARKKKKNRG